MKLSRTLNLVQPVETETGTVHLHSTPLAREVWERYYLVLTKTYAGLLMQGLNVIAGPPVALLMLRDVARGLGVLDGPEGVELGLIGEVRRLTNAYVPTEAGWQMLPYEEVLRRGLVDEDALAEAEGAIIFFICVSAVLRGPSARVKLDILLGGLMSRWGVETTSSDSMAYLASLPTSTPGAPSGAMPTTSSVPH